MTCTICNRTRDEQHLRQSVTGWRCESRRGSLVARSGYYTNGGIVWFDEAQRLTPEMMRAVRPVDRFTITKEGK